MLLPGRPAEQQQRLDLERRALAIIDGLPRMVAAGRQDDTNIHPGSHGRRRQGPGAEFWQFRPAVDGDPVRMIDWRRSARSDAHYVRDREMQTTNCIMFWADNSASMQFSGDRKRPAKADRARLIALAASILLSRADERVGALGSDGPPRPGAIMAGRFIHDLFREDPGEYGLPPAGNCPRGSRAVLLSDFLGSLEEIRRSAGQLAADGVAAILIQVLDPVETGFPFAGRTIFRSMGGRIEVDCAQAAQLREQYEERLQERISAVAGIAGEFGWHSILHVTDADAAPPLRWLCEVLGQGPG